jgi:transcriptional regulator with XRE-family HTH domain
MAGRPQKRVDEQYSTIKKHVSPICERIKELLDKGDIDDFCDKLEISKRTVYNWQSNKARPDIDRLGDIADYFGVTTDYLVGRIDNPAKTVDIVEMCEFTGLSKEAIMCLNTLYLEEFENLHDPILSSIICSDYFFEMVQAICFAVLAEKNIKTVKSQSSALKVFSVTDYPVEHRELFFHYYFKWFCGSELDGIVKNAFDDNLIKEREEFPYGHRIELPYSHYIGEVIEECLRAFKRDLELYEYGFFKKSIELFKGVVSKLNEKKELDDTERIVDIVKEKIGDTDCDSFVKHIKDNFANKQEDTDNA